uniref:Transmembrane protein n=1 Tax=Entomoneis paludosa TaxID=265537 RepID=A0A6U3C5M4_9STRA|mmetsp:Transcript_34493/g.71834  ORF Transcript_34493/g.71834 Transcript_34493/m.71834 type:complete len:218 (+) Transcript_34493:102-755(+)|eukprot:CAMPEP_0172465528 /NCGR_PEP_ID=MMETSP1065-20121228/53747_1 /TAXON_ID=265537 /ORGANISM="Amphiprora paludosa, Strain CCMP125" /LENGTH=217 /DNA_ID=CAMNT_0013222083 /DNA_START=50 /DNA_END=703 /DNA_ORIENTATION=-
MHFRTGQTIGALFTATLACSIATLSSSFVMRPPHISAKPASRTASDNTPGILTFWKSDENEHEHEHEHEHEVGELESSGSEKILNRGGGRSRKKKRQVLPAEERKSIFFFGTILPLLALIIIFRSLFFGGLPTGDSSVYYYTSTSFESTTYANGKVDTARKQSVKTNMPSLIDNKMSSPSESIEFRESRLAKDFDDQLEDEFNRMMRSERTIFDDFF